MSSGSNPDSDRQRRGRAPAGRSVGAAAAAVALALLSARADAAPPLPPPSLGVTLGPEYFSWRELDSAGNTLLHETGPRLAGELSLDDLNFEGPGVVYWLRGRGYVGYVDYSGQTQGSPAEMVSSNTRYLGGSVEEGGGYRFWLDSYGIDLFQGLGVEGWQRVIGDTVSPSGLAVSGTTETYRTVYLKGGLGLYQRGAGWMQHLQAGVKWPFNTRETAQFPGVDAHVSPRGTWSFFARWQIARLDANERRTLTFNVYYDSYRYNPSPAVVIPIPIPGGPGYEQIYQPESHEDVVGLQVGYYFNL